MTATVAQAPTASAAKLDRSGPLTFLGDTMLVFRRQMRLSLRNPAWVIIGLVQPILYLAFFGPLLSTIARSGALGVPAATPTGSSCPAC